MGLDMYLMGDAFRTHKHPDRKEGAKPFPIARVQYQVAYWRKHPNLHGYIVRNFADKDGNGEPLDDCKDIWLSEESLGLIIAACKGDGSEFTTTDGFFFGASDDTPEERAADAATFEAALKWLREKEEHVWKSVYYRASW